MMKFLILLILLVGCATSSKQNIRAEGRFIFFNPTSVGPDQDAKIAQSDIDQIAIIKDELQAGKCNDIGIIEVIGTGNGNGLSLEQLIPEVKKQAALMKADGIRNITSKRFNHSEESLHVTAMAFKYAKN